jgi:hypothetical protein
LRQELSGALEPTSGSQLTLDCDTNLDGDGEIDGQCSIPLQMQQAHPGKSRIGDLNGYGIAELPLAEDCAPTRLVAGANQWRLHSSRLSFGYDKLRFSGLPMMVLAG